MRTVAMILCCAVVIQFLTAVACFADGDRDDVVIVSKQIMVAIKNVDIEGVERFLREYDMMAEYPGVYKDIGILLRDTRSRLHRKLFNRRNSVKQFFDEAQNVFISIEFDGKDSELAVVTYSSPEIESTIWPKVTLEKVKGRWTFYDFFFNK